MLRGAFDRLRIGGRENTLKSASQRGPKLQINIDQNDKLLISDASDATAETHRILEFRRDDPNFDTYMDRHLNLLKMIAGKPLFPDSSGNEIGNKCAVPAEIYECMKACKTGRIYSKKDSR